MLERRRAVKNVALKFDIPHEGGKRPIRGIADDISVGVGVIDGKGGGIVEPAADQIPRGIRREMTNSVEDAGITRQRGGATDIQRPGTAGSIDGLDLRTKLCDIAQIDIGLSDDGT